MVPANNANRWLVPTQLLGASIQATLIVLPVVCGLQLLLRRFGYGQLVGTQAAVLILFFLTWAALFLSGPAGR